MTFYMKLMVYWRKGLFFYEYWRKSLLVDSKFHAYILLDRKQIKININFLSNLVGGLKIFIHINYI